MALRSLSADDIFISYARRDSSTYATGLADELTKQGFSCFIDRLVTEANRDLPDFLRRKVRSCAMLVVVGTAWSGTRDSIAEEIREFKKTARPIVPIDVDGTIGNAVWYGLIEGIALEPEKNAGALDDGNPSPSVVSRIEKSFRYARRNQRLRRVTLATTALLLLLMAASVVAGYVARSEAKRAAAERARAKQATADADRATQEACTDKDETAQAKEEADAARADAAVAKDEAHEQRLAAAAASKEALEKTRLADAATRRAQAAAREADRQTKIVLARQTATRADVRRAQAMRRKDNWVEMLQESVLLSVESARRFSAIRLSSADSEQSLRESLTVLPRATRMLEHPGEIKDALFSPDGKYLATLDGDNVLRFWDASTLAPVSEKKLDFGGEAFDFFSPDGQLLFVMSDGKLTALSVPQASQVWAKDLEGNIHLSADRGGKYIATGVRRPDPAGGEKGLTSVVVWGARDGREFTEVKHDGELQGVALSQDGDLLAVCFSKGTTGDDGSRKTVYVTQVWEVKNPARMITSKESEEQMAVPTFSPDGRLLAVASGYGADIWEISSWRRVTSIKGFPEEYREEISYMMFSPEGKTLGVTGDHGSVQTWDAVTGQRLWEVLQYEEVGSHHLSLTQWYVAHKTQPGLRVVDVTTGREAVRIMQHDDLDGYDANPGRNRLVVYRGKQLWVYDTGSAQEDRRLSYDGEGGRVLARSPDKKYVAVVGDKEIAVWDATAAREVARLKTKGEVGVLAFSPDDSRLAASCGDDSVYVWTLGDAPEEWRIPNIPFALDEETPNVRELTFSPRGRFLAFLTGDPDETDGPPDSVLKVLGVGDRREVASVASTDLYPSFSADEKYVAVNTGGVTRILDLWAGGDAATLPFGKGYGKVVFSPDCVHMARAHEGTIRVSEIRGARNGFNLTLAGNLVKFDFDAGGRYLAALVGKVGDVDGNRVQLWDAATGRPAAPLLALDRPAQGFKFSPGAKYLATFSGAAKVEDRGEVRVWEVSSGREVIRAQPAGSVNSSTDLLFSPDGHYAVTSGSDDSEVLLDLAGRHVVAELSHDGPIRDVTFSPDSRYVATAGDDRTARVWEASSGREVARVTHNDSVTSAVFTRDGRLATVGDDLTARLWPIAEGELIERACSNLTRNLSPEEWRRNFGNEKYAQTCRGKPAGKSAGESEEGAAVVTQQ